VHELRTSSDLQKRWHLAGAITMAYSNIFAIREGDQMVTFHGFRCIPGGTVVIIHKDGGGPYFECSEGKHYLKRQLNSGGICLGLTALL
jgi:hypothetical protein